MKKFKWTVEFTVDGTWVADGFVLTAYRATKMLLNNLPSVNSSEVKAKILAKPADADIAKAQGFASVKAWKDSYR